MCASIYYECNINTYKFLILNNCSEKLVCIQTHIYTYIHKLNTFIHSDIPLLIHSFPSPFITYPIISPSIYSFSSTDNNDLLTSTGANCFLHSTMTTTESLQH